MSVMNAFDIAEIFEQLPDNKLPVLFQASSQGAGSGCFCRAGRRYQGRAYQKLSDSELAAVIDELYVDDAADLAEEMPANVVRRILRHASPDMRKMINEILRYPDDSAGSIMNTEYISLRATMSVEHAVAHIRKTGFDKETINTLYVIDKGRHLIGVVSIRALLFAAPQDIIEDIMDTHSIIFVNTLDDKENVAMTFEKYNLTELPVTDTEKKTCGNCNG